LKNIQISISKVGIKPLPKKRAEHLEKGVRKNAESEAILCENLNYGYFFKKILGGKIMNELELKQQKDIAPFQRQMIANHIKIGEQRTSEETFKVGGLIWYWNEFEKANNENWTIEGDLMPLLKEYGINYSKPTVKRLVNFFVTNRAPRTRGTGTSKDYANVTLQEFEIEMDNFLSEKKLLDAGTHKLESVFNSEFLEPNVEYEKKNLNGKANEILLEMIKDGELKLEEFSKEELKTIKEKVLKAVDKTEKEETIKDQSLAEELKTNIDENRKLRQEMDNSKRELAEKENTCEVLTKQVEALKKEMQNSKDDKQKEKFLENLKMYQETLEIAKRDLTEEKQKNHETTKKLLESEKTLTQLKVELAAREKDLDKQKIAAEKAKTELEKEKTKNILLQQELNSYTEEENIGNLILEKSNAISKAMDTLSKAADDLIFSGSYAKKLKPSTIISFRCEEKIKDIILKIGRYTKLFGIETKIEFVNFNGEFFNKNIFVEAEAQSYEQ
jgi:hypothetical protein